MNQRWLTRHLRHLAKIDRIESAGEAPRRWNHRSPGLERAGPLALPASLCHCEATAAECGSLNIGQAAEEIALARGGLLDPFKEGLSDAVARRTGAVSSSKLLDCDALCFTVNTMVERGI